MRDLALIREDKALHVTVVGGDPQLHLLVEEDIDQRPIELFFTANQVVDGDAEVLANIGVELLTEPVIPVVLPFRGIMLALGLGEVQDIIWVPVLVRVVPPHDLTVLDVLRPGARITAPDRQVLQNTYLGDAKEVDLPLGSMNPIHCGFKLTEVSPLLTLANGNDLITVVKQTFDLAIIEIMHNRDRRQPDSFKSKLIVHVLFKPARCEVFVEVEEEVIVSRRNRAEVRISRQNVLRPFGPFALVERVGPGVEDKAPDLVPVNFLEVVKGLFHGIAQQHVERQFRVQAVKRQHLGNRR